MVESLRSLFKIGIHHRGETPEHLHVGEASKFYIACRDGDIKTVKEMLPTIPYDQLNQLEPNGNTPLHAATYFGHLDIVRLLLYERSCQRHLENYRGFTAYEEAQTDEMRQLYHRPSDENRFNDDSNDTKQIFEIVSSSSTNENDDDDNVTEPDHQYLIGFETNEIIHRQLEGLNCVKALFQSRIGRYIMEQGMKLKLTKEASYGEEEYAYVTNEKFRHEPLQKVLDEHVTSNHPEYEHCCHLLKEYIQHELKPRYYQGYSYRGVRLTQHAFNEYRWALKYKDSALLTFPFASTSIVQDVAEQFSAKSLRSPDKINALLIFHFPQPCDTAIKLSKIPEYQLPCISNYENEKEVLIGPRTFFKVTEIESNESNDRCKIYLENLCGEQKTVFKAVRLLVMDDLKKKTSKILHH